MESKSFKILISLGLTLQRALSGLLKFRQEARINALGCESDHDKFYLACIRGWGRRVLAWDVSSRGVVQGRLKKEFQSK